jgi:hypothetical protein
MLDSAVHPLALAESPQPNHANSQLIAARWRGVVHGGGDQTLTRLARMNVTDKLILWRCIEQPRIAGMSARGRSQSLKQ